MRHALQARRITAVTNEIYEGNNAIDIPDSSCPFKSQCSSGDGIEDHGEFEMSDLVISPPCEPLKSAFRWAEEAHGDDELLSMRRTSAAARSCCGGFGGPAATRRS